MKRVEIIEQAIGNFSCSGRASWRGVAEAVEAALTAAAQEQTAPEPPPETEADKLARLDPETMTKHPERWQVGDGLRQLCGGAVGLMEHIYRGSKDQWRVMVRPPHGTNPWLACGWEWLERPPLPALTVVLWRTHPWLVRVRSDGRYDLFRFGDEGRRSLMPHGGPAARSELRPLMLPPEGGW